MKPTIQIAALVFILALTVQACQADSSRTASGSVLFQDDFSNPSSGWLQGEDELGKTEYTNEGFRIYVQSEVSGKVAIPRLGFTDVRIEVDATKLAGPDDNDYGVICRFVDENNFYLFEISSDGYYSIGKYKDNELILIGMDKMRASEEIRQGQATNHLRADCVGSTLTLYVNGKKLAEVTDADFKAGDVGLIAGSFETPGVDIWFDNFTVLQP